MQVVLGPSMDGGFYLVGSSRAQPGLMKVSLVSDSLLPSSCPPADRITALKAGSKVRSALALMGLVLLLCR